MGCKIVYVVCGIEDKLERLMFERLMFGRERLKFGRLKEMGMLNDFLLEALDGSD